MRPGPAAQFPTPVLTYLTRRIILLVFSLWVVVTVSFVIVRVAPGSPFETERGLSAAALAQRKAQAGMGGDPVSDYVNYLGGLIQGDMKESQKQQGEKVIDIIGSTLPVSITLGLISLTLALMMGITLGTIAGVKQNSVFDFSSMGIAMIGISVPNFVLAVVLQLLLAGDVFIRVLPPTGWNGPEYLLMPAFCLALPFAARIARLTRVGMLEVFRQDFVRTARAKGLRQSAVVVKHCLIHAVLPVVSYIGPAAAGILTGSLVIEKIFSIPGIGQKFIDSALSRDYWLILGTIEVYSVILMGLILLSDLAYAVVDPRIAAGIQEGKGG